ncbi:MAG: topoisomerase-4 subunit B [Candidatus Binatia bacterium]|jgi:topoisomerase-4 subunit B
MAKEKKKPIYDESKVKTLSSIQHIRLRTGMYIGRLGDGSHYDDGCYILLKEIIDNAIDEYIMGYGKEVHIDLDSDTVVVRDFGRGIPLGKIVDCVSKINTGAKYNDDVFQFSVGLNGVGTKAVNALSDYFLVRSHRGGKFAEAQFQQGRLKGKDGGSLKEPNGTLIEFTPDPKIFQKIEWNQDHIARRLRHYSYLNAGLKLIYNGKTFMSKHGLQDLIDEEVKDGALYPTMRFADKTLDIAFTHSGRHTGETFFSFVNGQYTADGGTHLSAFREGLLKAVNEFSKKKYEGDDVREGVIGAIAIRLKDPMFESQTKNKLGNTEIRAELLNRVKDVVAHWLHRNREAATAMLQRIDDARSLRKEFLLVKKAQRERAKAVTIRIPQLKDCKRHFDRDKGKGDDSMIFITEGMSAAGSIVSCRDVNTQAIFTLKGKPLNVWDLKRDTVYKNDEMYNLMCALNIEDSIAKLRYHKVILATDADVDGLHIRNLLITYFFRFFDAVVQGGHLHVLETPLFRVRNKQKTIYCYSEAERDVASKELGRNPEITRFKGLGEISPGEFKAFVGDEMRLSQVEYASRADAADIFSFYMGKNTPERREYIMENLIVPKEE